MMMMMMIIIIIMNTNPMEPRGDEGSVVVFLVH